MAENAERSRENERKKVTIAALIATALAGYYARGAESEMAAQERARSEKIAQKLGATSGGFTLLENNLVGLAVAGVLLGSVHYGEKMRNYGKKEWRAMPGHFRKLISASI